MPTIYDNSQSQDNTIKIFDAFYAQTLIIPTDQFDIVLGYFKTVCGTKQIAENFTAVLFRIAQESGVDALALLDQLKGTANKVEMNKTMAYYLNTLKSKTNLYGVGVVPKPNQTVARNVVQ